MPSHPFDVPSAQSTTDKSITCRVVDAQHVSSLETIILIKTFIFDIQWKSSLLALFAAAVNAEKRYGNLSTFT